MAASFLVLYQLSFLCSYASFSFADSFSPDSPGCRSAADRLSTAAAGDAVPRLLALFYAADRHACVPCQSLRIEGNLIILIEHVRNIDALRTVGRAVTACGTRHAFCHLLRLFEQHCFCGVVHRRVRLKKCGYSPASAPNLTSLRGSLQHLGSTAGKRKDASAPPCRSTSVPPLSGSMTIIGIFFSFKILTFSLAS